MKKPLSLTYRRTHKKHSTKPPNTAPTHQTIIPFPKNHPHNHKEKGNKS